MTIMHVSLLSGGRLLSVTLLLHVIDDPFNVVVIKLGASILSAELDHVRSFFTFDLQDFGCKVARLRNLGRVVLEKLSKLFIHLGRVNRALNAVCDLPDTWINGQVVDHFAVLDYVGEPVKEIRSCDVCVHKVAAWDVLSAIMSVELERNDVSSLSLCFSEGPDTVCLATSLGSTSNCLTRASAALQRRHRCYLAISRIFTRMHILTGLFFAKRLIR